MEYSVMARISLRLWRARSRTSLQAFTLIELLVVLAIISVVCGLLLAAVQRAREAANRAECLNHLKQIGLALHGYHDSYGSFPQAYDCRALFSDPSKIWDGTQWIVTKSWATLILPFLEQANLDRQGFAAYQGQDLPVYHCPSDQRSTGVWKSVKFGTDGLTDYLAVTGTDTFRPYPNDANWRDRNDGVIYGSSHIRIAQICDGNSNTVLVGERPPSPDLFWGWWSALDASLGVRDTFTVYGLGVRGDFNSQSCYRLLPENYRPGIGNNCDVHHFWSQHPGGANWIFADGSVRFLSYANASTMPALATRAGGEVGSELE
jgi:prepilin-type N-terminal cleavage/methylation domain-containing protein/prepilin-type processing-associated H-X9-DG protein